MWCTDPLRMEVGAPHQCPLDSVAGYLCHFMLTCGRTFRWLIAMPADTNHEMKGFFLNDGDFRT